MIHARRVKHAVVWVSSPIVEFHAELNSVQDIFKLRQVVTAIHVVRNNLVNELHADRFSYRGDQENIAQLNLLLKKAKGIEEKFNAEIIIAIRGCTSLDMLNKVYEYLPKLKGEKVIFQGKVPVCTLRHRPSPLSLARRPLYHILGIPYKDRKFPKYHRFPEVIFEEKKIVVTEYVDEESPLYKAFQSQVKRLFIR
jgi:hypothetical protein